ARILEGVAARRARRRSGSTQTYDLVHGPLLLAPLPLGECSRILASLPVLKGATLVVETEVTAGKPPLDGAPERGASAPAIRVAGAGPPAGIVDSLEERSRDPRSLLSRRHALRRAMRFHSHLTLRASL